MQWNPLSAGHKPSQGGSKGADRLEQACLKPRFRIQEAILILRQGKTHPQWREAAWHLMEYAGKDTQLLLEAQRDLIEQGLKPEGHAWAKYACIAGLCLTILVLMSGLVWKVIEHFKLVC